MFGALLRLARVVPRAAWIGLGAAVGDLARRLDRRHTRIAYENLRLAYGDTLDPAEVDRIVRECWRHFGRITFDALAFPQLSAEAAGSIVSYEGLEHLRAAYARGKGVLVFSGHYGHWELTAVMQGHLGLPLALLGKVCGGGRPGSKSSVAPLIRCSSGGCPYCSRKSPLCQSV